MFDDEASCPMTGDLSMIQEAEQVSPIAIGLPNGMQIFAGKEGSVLLDNRIRLNNVLFVPSLTCNLVSVAKFCEELNCCVAFFDDFFVLQDRTLKILIGAGEQRGDVYYLKEGSLEKNQVNAISSTNLWHKRLGHSSHGVLSLLPTDLGVISDKTKDNVCETCYQAKQTRNRFPMSSNKAKCVFELIHCDIWGPYRESSSCGTHYFLTIVDDASWATWVYLMVERNEAKSTLKGPCCHSPKSIWD